MAIAVGWLLAFPGTIALGALTTALLPQSPPPHFEANGLAVFLALVVFSPVVETLMMGGILLLLLRFLSPVTAIVVSAVGWGIAHSTMAPIWGLVIWWPFLIFSTLFVTWRSRSLSLAFALPMCVHILHNLIPSWLIAFGR